DGEHGDGGEGKSGTTAQVARSVHEVLHDAAGHERPTRLSILESCIPVELSEMDREQTRSTECGHTANRSTWTLKSNSSGLISVRPALVVELAVPRMFKGGQVGPVFFARQ